MNADSTADNCGKRRTSERRESDTGSTVVAKGINETELRKYWQRYQSVRPHREWLDGLSQALTDFRDMPNDVFASPASQQKLWKIRPVSGLGPGEAVGTEGAYTDDVVIGAFAGLRNQDGQDIDQQAALREAYETVLSAVYPAHASKRPMAKLLRALTAVSPRDMLTAYSASSQRAFANLFLGGARVNAVDCMVRVRRRVREILGPESSTQDDADRMVFLWWLLENVESVSRDVTGDQLRLGDRLKLEDRPRAGITASREYVEAYRTIIWECREGAERDDVVDVLRSEHGFGGHKRKSTVSLFNRVRRLGLLEIRNGLWFPSADGLLLVQEDLPDVLVERLLVQTFGIPHTLRMLREPGSLSRSEIFRELRRIYPAWTKNFAPSAVLAWVRALGLVDIDTDGKQRLNEYGRAWERRLPEELPVPPFEEVLGIGHEPESAQLAPVSWAQMIVAIRADAELTRFVFEDGQWHALYTAWHFSPQKRFVLLSGLSGTGKTQLLIQFARIYCGLLGLNLGTHLATVPVSPDWRDPSGLLGYLNTLGDDATYHVEPALRLVLDAAENPDKPYFLVLDEMNLARVERYFAPFLSAMETGDDVVLHGEQDVDLVGVPTKFAWPRNLFVGGTVNMDETTYPFSDKVLDRAFTFEFWEVDLEAFFARRKQPDPTVQSVLTEAYDALLPARRHFGYRTAGEILDFVAAGGGGTELLDQAVFSKILPKLRGDDTSKLGEAIAALEKLCVSHQLNRSAGKLKRMRESIEGHGLTQFFS